MSKFSFTIPALLLIVTFLSGCGTSGLPWAPQDQKLSKSDLQKTDFGSLRVGKYAMSVLNTELISRDLEVLRGALFSSYATQKGMSQQVSLQGDETVIEFDQKLNYKPQQAYQAQQTWHLRIQKNEDQSLNELSAFCSECLYTWTATLRDGKKQIFTLAMSEDKFTVKKLADGTYAVSTVTKGRLVGEAFGKNGDFNLESNSNFILSDLTEQLPQSTVRKLKATLSLKKGLYANITSEEMSHQVTNNCGHFVGTINHSSGKQVANLRISTEGVEVMGDSWRTRYFSCQEQPLLDMGRLLQEDKAKK